MDRANQVHVESLESIEHLATQLASASGRLEDLCLRAAREADLRLEAANGAFDEAIRHAEAARDKVAHCESELDQCELAAAAACGGSNEGEEDSGSGDGDTHSCAAEAAALAEAADVFADAESNLARARKIRQWTMQAHEAINASVFLTRQHLADHLGAGIEFLHRKIGQLRDYLLNHPELSGISTAGAASYAHAWLTWHPPDKTTIGHPLLAQRFSIPPGALADLTQRWVRNDPSLARQIQTLRERHGQASTPGELEAVRMASRRGAAGRLGELLAENALRPMARSIEMQRRTQTGDNANATITDIVLRGLRIPINVGKLQIASGADASVEVKCGTAAYLKQQLTHMQLQVAGHHNEQASFCFLSRDFKRLDRDSKHEIAQTLGKQRSKIFALLPEKTTLDSLVWKQIAHD